MLELLMKGRACPACGGGVWHKSEGGHGAERDVPSLSASDRGGLARAPRARSGLAHAAACAGVLHLCRPSFAPLVFAQAGPEWTLALGIMFVWGLLSPAAL